MNYEAHYEKLIERAYNRTLPSDVYTENHHILPQALYPEFKTAHWNICKLLPEEHMVAHRLLQKIYKGNYSMINAVFRMSGIHRYCGNKKYASLKKEFSKAHSAIMKERCKDPEFRKKMSDCSPYKGKPISEKLRQSIIESNKNRVVTDEMKRKISEKALARGSMSEETKKKISEATKGHRRHTPEQIAIIKASNAKRYRKFEVTDPEGNKYTIVGYGNEGGLIDFCKERGFLAEPLRKLAEGKTKGPNTKLGWSCKFG